MVCGSKCIKRNDLLVKNMILVHCNSHHECKELHYEYGQNTRFDRLKWKTLSFKLRTSLSRTYLKGTNYISRFASFVAYYYANFAKLVDCLSNTV